MMLKLFEILLNGIFIRYNPYFVPLLSTKIFKLCSTKLSLSMFSGNSLNSIWVGIYLSYVGILDE